MPAIGKCWRWGLARIESIRWSSRDPPAQNKTGGIRLWRKPIMPAGSASPGGGGRGWRCRPRRLSAEASHGLPGDFRVGGLNCTISPSGTFTSDFSFSRNSFIMLGKRRMPPASVNSGSTKTAQTLGRGSAGDNYDASPVAVTVCLYALDGEAEGAGGRAQCPVVRHHGQIFSLDVPPCQRRRQMDGVQCP